VPGAQQSPNTAKALPCVAHGEEHTRNPPMVNITFTHGQIISTRQKKVTDGGKRQGLPCVTMQAHAKVSMSAVCQGWAHDKSPS